MKHLGKRWVMLVAVVLVGLAGCSQSAARDDGIKVDEIWARPVSKGDMGTTSAVYMGLTNLGPAADTLIAAETDVADKTEIHETTMNDNVMQMKHVGSYELPPGVRVELKPGGKHIMLIGIKRDLNVGDTFTVKLRFENAGEREIVATVREP